MQGVLCRLLIVSLLAADVIAISRRYLESCVNTADCVYPFLCLSSLCNCDTNKTIGHDRVLCLPGVKHGYPCRETGQCLFELADTYCGDSNHCECARGYGYDPANSSCSIIINGVVPHRGKCRVDRQCKSGMICPGETCECRTGLQYDRTSLTCIHIRPETEMQGPAPPTRIAASLGTHSAGTTTVSAGRAGRRYLESCVNTAECVHPFLCLSSLCNCDTNMTIGHDRVLCLPGVKHGDPCRETGQCLFELADTYCSDSNHCECARGYGYDPINSSCSIIINGVVSHRGKCRVDRQCKSGMICPGYTCECRTGLQYDRTSLTCIHIELV